MRSSKDREQCLKYAEKGLCRWEMGTCQQDGCWNLNNKSSCQSSPLPCEWKEENEIDQRCVEMNCYQYQISADCESKKDKLNCAWRPNYCSVEDKCQEFQNEYGICNTQPTCQWSTGFNRWEGNPAKFPPILWAVWIIINIAFIGIILAVIGYGTSEHLPKIINLGIIFFALDVITRYVGFIMDLWGYTSLAVIFITGGIILVFGGWGIEKWRRKLVGKTRTSATKE
ncbi:hypothetical protein HYU13_01470 [Candidatus Woesearchaeota archaeon]|nr:hypothetical protein [Candidatus Woesearchaeota archaeon]